MIYYLIWSTIALAIMLFIYVLREGEEALSKDGFLSVCFLLACDAILGITGAYAISVSDKLDFSFPFALLIVFSSFLVIDFIMNKALGFDSKWR